MSEPKIKKATYKISMCVTIEHTGEYENDATQEGEDRAIQDAKSEARVQGEVIDWHYVVLSRR